MQELRLIGVQEDGGHLLLADEYGSRFRVALDEALRAAARHHRRPAGQVPLDVESGHRPREVQALVRAGLTAQEVAERCGWPLEKVHKYEVPILAEREYVAGLARLVRLRPRGSSSQPSPTLAGRVAGRLETRGVDVAEVSWDAFRPAGSEWTVVLTFPAGGRQRQATWGFDPSTHAIHPRDDEARWFSEDDPAAAEVVREVPVYDVEAEGGVGADSRAQRPTEPSDPLDLVTTMRQRSSARSRRGARRRPAEDVALPLEAGSSPNGVDGAVQVVAPEAPEPTEAGTPGDPSDEPTDALPAPMTHVDAEAVADPAVEAGGDPALDEQLDIDPQVGDGPDLVVSMDPAPRPGRKPPRVPVPSWEDVVLGTKPSADQ